MYLMNQNSFTYFTQFLQDNIHQYVTFDKLAGYQYMLERKIKDEGIFPQKYTPGSFLQNLCTFNTWHLYSAIRPVETQNFQVFCGIVRVVFESFPKMLYGLCHKDEVPPIFCSEEYKYAKDRRETPDPMAREFCKQFKQQVRNEDYLDASWFRDQVYEGDRLDYIKRQYKFYSVNAHPNFEPAYGLDVEETRKGQRDCLSLLNDYALFNLFILTNVMPAELEKLSEFENTKLFITDMLNEHGRDGVEIIYPNVEKYTENLAFPLPANPSKALSKNPEKVTSNV